MSTQTPVYDSADPRRPILDEFQNFWERRSLIRLLVARDLTLRYKRSVLGVWWTMLNPILMAAVMWLVFSQLFTGRFGDTGVPFIVYLLSGILLISMYFSQGVMAAGNSLLGSRAILTRINVPGEVFSLTAALAAAANFTIGLIPLLIIQVLTGIGVPWTIVLVPIPTIAMLGLVAGLGMMIAAAAVHFFDVIDFVRVLIQLSIWLVPTFYPIEIVPDALQWLIKINPLYSCLVVFRGFVYAGTFAPMWNFAMMAVSAVFFLALGVWIFAKSFRNLAVRL